MNLTAGRSLVQFARDIGSPNAVQNFIADGEVQGVKSSSGLPFNYIFQAAQRSTQFAYFIVVGNQFWIKISGAWKTGTMFVKVAGVWKPTTPHIKIGGVWK